MSHALFIADARPEAGLGHITRSRALAAELGSRGWTCDFLAQGESGEGDVLVVDLYHRGGEPPVHVGNRARFVQIADKPSLLPTLLLSKSETARPDLLVDGGAGAIEADYHKSGAARVLAGPSYALLRAPFRNTSYGKNGYSSSHDWYDLRKMDGGWTDEGVADLMAASRVVLTAAGMRAMEAACVGAPMVLFIESEDQQSNALALQKRCAGIIASDEAYGRKLARELLKDPDWLARMSHAGRTLVDGRGVERVADAIEELV